MEKMKLPLLLIGQEVLMGLYLKLMGLMGKDMCLIDPPVVMDGLPRLPLALSVYQPVPLSKKMDKTRLPFLGMG